MVRAPSFRPCILAVRLTLTAGLGLATVGLHAQTTYPPTGTTNPFLEPGYPFAHSKVEITPDEPSQGGNLVIRGILIPLGDGVTVSFAQELLRAADAWVTLPAELERPSYQGVLRDAQVQR